VLSDVPGAMTGFLSGGRRSLLRLSEGQWSVRALVALVDPPAVVGALDDQWEMDAQLPVFRGAERNVNKLSGTSSPVA
jgi:hypothetical protein